MKKIIDGKAYNTETAAIVATKPNSHSVYRIEPDGSQNRLVGTDLFRTQGGAFFYCDRYERGDYKEIRPLNRKGAMTWMEQNDFNADEIEKVFGDIPEAGEVVPIYLRLPDVLRQRVVEAAKSEDLSMNAFAMRCLERCIALRSDALDSVAPPVTSAGGPPDRLPDYP